MPGPESPLTDLDDQQLLRYSRQIFLPDIDIEGQQKLLASSVMILGLGGLGSPAAMYLAASGIGRIFLVDPDQVELSNLQRQLVHTTASLGSDKVSSAAETLQSLNPDVQVEIINRALTRDEMTGMLAEIDVVVDGTDNLDARFTANSACQASATPLVSGAVTRFEGQVSVFPFRHGEGPCYQCLYSRFTEQPLNCSETGVLGSVAGIVGSIQATEAVKLILGIGQTLSGRLLVLDAKEGAWNTLLLDADPGCKVCSS